MSPKTSLSFALSCLAAFCFPSQLNAQQAPKLATPQISPTGDVLLVVNGEAGTNYAFEASTDLALWWKEDSGVATNGQVSFSYKPVANSGPRYFRAKVNVPAPALNVTAQTDTNFVGLSVVSQDSQTVVSFADSRAVQYTLTIPSNALARPQLVSMTLVTNLAGLPFSAGLLAGVSLEPAGQLLAEPAQLQIEFPTNVLFDPAAVVGYRFDAAAGNLSLTWAASDTNRVTLTVFSLGGFGCSVATPGEVPQFSQRTVVVAGMNSSPSTAKGVYFPTRLDECYPDKLARARQVDRRLELDLADFDQRLTAMAVQLMREYPLGHTPADWAADHHFRWPGNQDWIYSEFYTREIDPYLVEAASNCALTEVLAHRIKALEKLADMWGGSATAAIGAHGTLCTGFNECFQEFDACCTTHGLGGYDVIIDAQSIADEAKTFGCTVDQSALNRLSHDCLPTWSGQITILHIVSNYESTATETLKVEDKVVQKSIVTYTTDSTGLSGNATGEGMYGIAGTMKGSGVLSSTENFYSVDSTCCASCTTTFTASGGGTAKGTGIAGFTWQLTNSPPPPFPVPLINNVTPNNDLAIALTGLPWSGTQIYVGSGMVTDPHTGQNRCEVFSPEVTPSNGKTDYGGISNYFVTDTGVQGTVTSYQGMWFTNYMDGTTTTFVVAKWNFQKNP